MKLQTLPVMFFVALLLCFDLVVGQTNTNEANDTAIKKPTTEDDVTEEETEELKRRQRVGIGALVAARSVVLTQKMYPSRPIFIKALSRFNESPYPLLIGTSIFFLSLYLLLIGYYLRKFVSKLLAKTGRLVELYPETPSFPDVKLYNLQQSKREARLRREARNTWAWMANKYLLMPHDPNVQTTSLTTTWSDFDIPKDVWSIVRAVMKVNGLFHHVNKNNTGKANNKSKQHGHHDNAKHANVKHHPSPNHGPQKDHGPNSKHAKDKDHHETGDAEHRDKTHK